MIYLWFVKEASNALILKGFSCTGCERVRKVRKESRKQRVPSITKNVTDYNDVFCFQWIFIKNHVLQIVFLHLCTYFYDGLAPCRWGKNNEIVLITVSSMEQFWHVKITNLRAVFRKWKEYQQSIPFILILYQDLNNTK